MRARIAKLIAFAAFAAVAMPAPAGAQALDASCQLALTRLEATTTNVLAVDTNAVYWVTGYAGLRGARLRIDGRFPWSRFMGFNVYDPLGRPIEAIADRQIRPDHGSVNPFSKGARRFAKRRDYTLFVEFGPKPPNPNPNTIYTESSGGTFWYRVYIPDQGRDEKGGVPLPRVRLELPGGGEPSLDAPDACRELALPHLGELNELIEQAPPLPLVSGTAYPGRNPPNWRLFVNLGRGALDIMLDNEFGEQFHEDALETQSEGPGFFSSSSISYVFAPTSRGFGEVLVLRGRAPTYADTRRGARRMPRGPQVRYWSFCQYEPATQRVIACRPDDRVAVNRRGRYRIVVSTAAQRPRNARRRCGFTWLPWGPATQGLLIYRQMLARRSFAQAIARIPEPGKEREVMRAYYPRSRYVAGAAAFEKRGCRDGR